MFFTILNQNEFRIATVAMFTCDLYAGPPPPHDLERLCTTMQLRVVDFVRVGYFIPRNDPLNRHKPSIILDGYPASLGFPIMHRVHAIYTHAYYCHHVKSCHPSDKQYTEFIIYTCSRFLIFNNKVSMARDALSDGL